MLKEKRQLFEFVFVIFDLIVVAFTWLFSYWLRFQTDFIPPEKGVPLFNEYLLMLPIIWIIWFWGFKKFGLYKAMRGVSRGREVFLLVQANLFCFLLTLSFIYLFREKTVEYSRLVFVIFGSSVLVLTILLRIVLRFFLREIRRKGYNLRYILVVGAGKVAKDIVQRIRKQKELGFQLVGCLAHSSASYSNSDDSYSGNESTRTDLPIIGNYVDLPTILSCADIDQIIVAVPLEHTHLIPMIIEDIGDSLVDVKIVPDLYRFISLGGAIEEFEGLPMISVRTSPMEGVGIFVKRFLDIVFSLIAIILLSPIMLLVALLVKLTSRGPVLYKQERVSLDGTKFNILKFRTMRTDAEESGPGWTTKGDSRVTPLGKFLRSSSLDELPQLFNVLAGSMSMVGPRPERPVYISEFRHKFPGYMLRHKVPAGITGWAQVNGWRGDTSIDKRIEFDLYYIENWSIILDVKIIFMTVFKGFWGRNAY